MQYSLNISMARGLVIIMIQKTNTYTDFSFLETNEIELVPFLSFFLLFFPSLREKRISSRMIVIFLQLNDRYSR